MPADLIEERIFCIACGKRQPHAAAHGGLARCATCGQVRPLLA